MKLLTIGITTYNNDPLIYNLMYEINSQIEKDKSILEDIDFYLYDDNSTSNDFLNHLPSYIQVKQASANGGSPAFGRNYIIDNSNSKYIFFIDGDDILIRDLTDIICELRTLDNDIIFSDVKKIGGDGQILDSSFIFTKELLDKETSETTKEKICVHQTGIWSIYKLAFLQENNLRYDLEMRYEDNYFLFNILLNNPSVGVLSESYYGWRTNYSSFSHGDDSTMLRAAMYEKTVQLLQGKLDNKFAPYILFSIWNQTYTNIMRNYPAMTTKEAKKYFKRLETITRKYQKDINTLINAADSDYVDSFFRHGKNRLTRSFFQIRILRAANRIIKSRVAIKKHIAKMFIALPMRKNKIFMTSHYGDYGSNPKYLYLQLRENPDCQIVYFTKDKSLLDNKDFKDYNNRLLFYYHFYTAKTVYFDSWLDPKLTKRKGQKWIQMWHGYPYKKVYTDIELYFTVNSQQKHQEKLNNIRTWDEVHALDAKNKEIFSKLFPSANVIEYEYDRIKWLKANADNQELKAQIRAKYNLSPTQKYTLYAPTYRPYKVYFDTQAILNMASADHELVYHPHGMLNSNFEFNGTILSNVDIQEILLVMDELITDYSSIKYDFMQINPSQKVLEYTPDEELYRLIHGLY